MAKHPTRIKATWTRVLLPTLCAAACAAVVALPASADWLVTKEGGRLETKGPWQVKGKLVVFSLSNGTLSSVRVENVDFEASRKATENALKKQETEPTAQGGEGDKPKKKSVVILTDKDFKHTAPAAQAAGTAGGQPGTDKDKDQDKNRVDLGVTQPGNLQVVSWDRAADSDSAKAGGVQLTGTVRNTSSDHLTALGVTASLFDESGTLVARVAGQLAAPDLAPGQTTTFSLTATGVFTFSAVKFDTQAHGFKIRPKEEAPAPGQPASSSPPS